MSERFCEQIFPTFLALDGEAIELEIVRDVMEPGRTFSHEAMEQTLDQITVFIGTRVMRRWDQTQEPPSVLRIELRVTVG